jgi:hypothetical protein
MKTVANQSIDTALLATVTGGANVTAVNAVQDAVISSAGHAGLLNFGKKVSVTESGNTTRVCGTFSMEREPGSHSYCGTYNPSLGSPSPDINVTNLGIH